MCAPAGAAAGWPSWGGLSRRLAAPRTREEPLSRSGPDGGLRCGRKARLRSPSMPLPSRRPIEAFVDEGGPFDFVNCECAEIEWLEQPMLTGGSEAPPPTTLRWRRLHPRVTDWSTPADVQAAYASAGRDAREL